MSVQPMLVLVDSSYFIRLLTLRRDPFLHLQSFELDYDFAINGVIWAEVLRGRTEVRLRETFDEAFAITRLLHLSATGWQRVARLAWEMDRRGEIIPLTDLIIGVTALEHGACVLTFDRHFKKIPGLVSVADLA